MSKVGLSDYSSYLHTYEAYRVNKKNISDDIPGAKNIKGEPGESVYVLTDKARDQLVKDRLDYGALLKCEEEQEYAKQRAVSEKEYERERARAMEVYKRLCKGDTVPATDENKLMQFDDKLYKMAKMAQMMAQQQAKRREKHDSLWENEENEEHADYSKAQELSQTMPEKVAKLSNAQTEHIAEISGEIDMSQVSAFQSLGNGLYHAVIDVSV